MSVISSTSSSDSSSLFPEPIRSPIERLKLEMEVNKKEHPDRQNKMILVSGAGPAGLICTMEALVQGFQVKLIEKRVETAPGRDQIVAVRKGTKLNVETDTLGVCHDELKRFGIIEWLQKEGCIYPILDYLHYGPMLQVRIGDLECAFKTRMQELDPTFQIDYSSTIKKVENSGSSDKYAKVTIQTNDTSQVVEPEKVIIAEGKNSSTNKLIGLGDREVCLIDIPVVAAIAKSPFPEIDSIGSFFACIGIAIKIAAQFTYYFTIYIGIGIYEACCKQTSTLSTELILQIPKQHYMGYSFNLGASEILKQVNDDMKALKQRCRSAKGNEKNTLEAQIEQKQALIKSHLIWWGYYAYFSFNLKALAHKIITFFSNLFTLWQHSYTSPTALTPFRPITDVHIVNLGADKSKSMVKRISRTDFIPVGDALATVDAATGLGAVTAIETNSDFRNLLENENHYSMGLYKDAMEHRIETIHEYSQMIRALYAPDAMVEA